MLADLRPQVAVDVRWTAVMNHEPKQSSTIAVVQFVEFLRAFLPLPSELQSADRVADCALCKRQPFTLFYVICQYAFHSNRASNLTVSSDRPTLFYQTVSLT